MQCDPPGLSPSNSPHANCFVAKVDLVCHLLEGCAKRLPIEASSFAPQYYTVLSQIIWPGQNTSRVALRLASIGL